MTDWKIDTLLMGGRRSSYRSQPLNRSELNAHSSSAPRLSGYNDDFHRDPVKPRLGSENQAGVSWILPRPATWIEQKFEAKSLKLRDADKQTYHILLLRVIRTVVV